MVTEYKIDAGKRVPTEPASEFGVGGVEGVRNDDLALQQSRRPLDPAEANHECCRGLGAAAPSGARRLGRDPDCGVA